MSLADPPAARDLRHVDLNLLVAFAALMETRSVTRAAEVLRIGQPSASHALKRLRDLTGDPLFTRGPGGMVPTPRALALDEPIRTILDRLAGTLFDRGGFDPAGARRTFRVGATDYAQAAIAEPLLARLLERAPGCRLVLTATDCDHVGGSLERGEIDLAFGAFPRLPAGPHQQHLYDDRYRCVFDAAACEIGDTITMEQWLALPHAIMSTRGDYAGPLDTTLAARGLSRHVAVSTPHFLAIPHLLRGKRLVAALPARLADRSAREHGLAACDLPFDAPPFPVTMLWHSRSMAEAGNAWLRAQVAELCGDQPARPAAA